MTVMMTMRWTHSSCDGRRRPEERVDASGACRFCGRARHASVFELHAATQPHHNGGERSCNFLSVSVTDWSCCYCARFRDEGKGKGKA